MPIRNKSFLCLIRNDKMEFNLTENEILARSKVCLALDVPSTEEASRYVSELHEVVGLYKVGKELFTSEGPDVVKVIQKEGGDVFLDLKYHDIPNTVRAASKAATKLGVSMFNVHASGGNEMMQYALKGVEEGVKEYGVERPKVIGVTILTSIDDRIMNEELGISGKVEDQVLKLAKLAENSGLDGIVCSAADLHAVKDHLRKGLIYVTPGVKGPRTKAGTDQKRVFTPGNAMQDGSSILVIGRAITDPFRRGKGKTSFEEMRTSGYDILQDMAPYV